MKKIFLTALAVLMTVPVLAQEVDDSIATSPVISSQLTCDPLAPAHVAAMEKIATILTQKADKLDSSVGSNSLLKEEVASIRKGLIGDLEYTIEQHELGQCNYIYRTLDETVTGLKNYVTSLKELIVVNKKLRQVKSYAEANNLMYGVQKDIQTMASLFSIGFNESARLEEVKGTLQIESNDMIVESNFTTANETHFSLKDETFSSLFSLVADVQGSIEGQNVSFDGEIGLDMRFLQDILYVGLTNLDFSVLQGPIELQAMALYVPVIKEVFGQNFIAFSSEEESYDNVSQAVSYEIMSLLEIYTIFNSVMNSEISLIDFVHQENNTYYGVLHDDFCALLDKDEMRNCLYSRTEMLRETDYKGFFFLRDEGNGSYGFGITDKFLTSDVGIDDVAHLFDKSLVSFSANEGISTIAIPFDEKNETYGFFYSDGKMNALFADEDASLTMEGEINNELIDATIVFDDFDNEGSFTIDFMAKKINSLSSSVTFMFTSELPDDGSASLAIQGEVTEKTYVTPSKPINTITPDIFTEKLNTALENGGLDQ